MCKVICKTTQMFCLNLWVFQSLPLSCCFAWMAHFIHLNSKENWRNGVAALMNLCLFEANNWKAQIVKRVVLVVRVCRESRVSFKGKARPNCHSEKPRIFLTGKWYKLCPEQAERLDFISIWPSSDSICALIPGVPADWELMHVHSQRHLWKIEFA